MHNPLPAPVRTNGGRDRPAGDGHDRVPGARASGGRGLSGMAERAELLGGELTAGRDGDGWRLAVRLPGPVS